MSDDNNTSFGASIAIAEYRLGVLPASHTFVIVDTGSGKPAELHGFSIDVDGSPNRIGMPWDSADTIEFHELHSPTWMARKAREDNRTHIIFQGTSEQVEEILRVARNAGWSVNEIGLDYLYFDQISNSVTNTIL